jgi:glycosyltransferase involved in cell wall biosynthesis
MVSQTILPERWIIVDDGSTDRTAEIVDSYRKRHSWIQLVHRPCRLDRNFAGKVYAFNAGLEQARTLQFEFVGNLDADVSFGPDHFEFLLRKLSEDSTLGVVGTAYNEEGFDSTKDSFEGENSVHGACQLFRYDCFRDIGGYLPNPAGGIDWIAVTTARMKGWRTRNFQQRRFRHHRTMGTAQRSPVGAMFDYGKKDYFLGGSPIWELFRVIYRMTKPPVLFGGLALFSGFFWAALRRTQRPVSRELMRFHRREQMQKLKTILISLMRFKKLEKFYLKTEASASRSVHFPGEQIRRVQPSRTVITSMSSRLKK